MHYPFVAQAHTRIKRTNVSLPLIGYVAKIPTMARYHMLALLPLLLFGFDDNDIVFASAFSTSSPSKYASTISGAISTSLTQESSTSKYPSQ